MKTLFSLLIIVLFCSCHKVGEPVNGLASNKTFEPRQTELIYEVLKGFPVNTQFAIAIIKDGSITFLGAMRQQDTITSVGNHTKVFEIGSITKVFTSTLLAQMATEGKIILSSKINDHTGVPLKDNVAISFQQLANHTSGFPRLPSNLLFFAVDPKNPYKDYDEKKLNEFLTNELKLSQDPGKKYEYSNVGAGLLGHLLTKVSGKSYEELLQDRIFTKLGMLNSTTLRSKVQNKLVKGLNAQGEEAPNWDLNVLMGAGGILSTSEDLSKFAQAQFDESNESMKLTRLKTFDINNDLSIGLGWHISKREGREIHWHNGGTGGYRSALALNVLQKNAVIVLSNVSAFHKDSGKIDNLCFELINSLQ
jgi:CubicO group peptidase (beta-lactamase class C family)